MVYAWKSRCQDPLKLRTVTWCSSCRIRVLSNGWSSHSICTRICERLESERGPGQKEVPPVFLSSKSFRGLVMFYFSALLRHYFACELLNVTCQPWYYLQCVRECGKTGKELRRYPVLRSTGSWGRKIDNQTSYTRCRLLSEGGRLEIEHSFVQNLDAPYCTFWKTTMESCKLEWKTFTFILCSSQRCWGTAMGAGMIGELCLQLFIFSNIPTVHTIFK